MLGSYEECLDIEGSHYCTMLNLEIREYITDDSANHKYYVRSVGSIQFLSIKYVIHIMERIRTELYVFLIKKSIFRVRVS
jgi:hypothetical protein